MANLLAQVQVQTQQQQQQHDCTRSKVKVAGPTKMFRCAGLQYLNMATNGIHQGGVQALLEACEVAAKAGRALKHLSLHGNPGLTARAKVQSPPHKHSPDPASSSSRNFYTSSQGSTVSTRLPRGLLSSPPLSTPPPKAKPRLPAHWSAIDTPAQAAPPATLHGAGKGRLYLQPLSATEPAGVGVQSAESKAEPAAKGDTDTANEHHQGGVSGDAHGSQTITPDGAVAAKQRLVFPKHQQPDTPTGNRKRRIVSSVCAVQ